MIRPSWKGVGARSVQGSRPTPSFTVNKQLFINKNTFVTKQKYCIQCSLNVDIDDVNERFIYFVSIT